MSEEQNQLIRELKGLDPDQPFKGIPEVQKQQQHQEEHSSKGNSPIDMFFEVDYDPEHEQLRTKLLSYRSKSEQIYQVGELLKQYESKFGNLMEDKDRLIDLLKSMKGVTS